VYELKLELEEKGGTDGTGDPLWWEEMATGLRPHLGDLGVPNHGPRGGGLLLCRVGVADVRSELRHVLVRGGRGQFARGGGFRRHSRRPSRQATAFSSIRFRCR
jgi:hypothetical protein